MGSIITSFISWIVPALGAWAVKFFTRKVVTVTTTVGTFVLITGVMIACIKNMIDTLLTLAVLPTWLTGGVAAFVPSDFAIVLGAIVSSRACRWAYDLAVEKIRMMNSAT